MSNSIKEKDTSKNKNVSKQMHDKVRSKKSIFYDPEWNPEGIEPIGERNVPYNPVTFKRKNELNPRLAGLSPANWKQPTK